MKEVDSQVPGDREISTTILWCIFAYAVAFVALAVAWWLR